MRFSLVLLSLLGSLALCHADAVHLQINGPDGKPVVGAKVRLTESRGDWWKRELEPLHVVTSDAAGSVTFETKAPLEKAGAKGQRPVPGSRLLASVQAPGLAVRSAWLQAGDNTLVLQPSQTFEGVALDGNQKPISGVHLRVGQLTDEEQRVTMADAQLLQATTDGEGHYRIEGLPREGNASLEVDDAKWKRETFVLDLAHKAPPLFLERGVTVKGRLLKPDGTPAAGVRLYAALRSGQEVTTGTDGSFEATGLSSGSAYLQVVERGQNLGFVVPAKQLSDLKAGEVRDLGDWKTTKGVRARGRIVAADTGKPIKDAYVSLWGGSDGSGTTDAQGRFDFLMPPGGSVITVRAEGFVALLKPGMPEASNGFIEVGTLELKRGKTVSGLLIDDKGDPIANAEIIAQKKNGNTGDDRSIPKADGRFSFVGLDEGEYTVRVAGYKVTQGAKFSVGGTTPTPSLRIVVTSENPAAKAPTTPGTNQRVTGRVVGADGTGIAGAKVDVRLMFSENSYQPRRAISQIDGSFSIIFDVTYSGRGSHIKVVSVQRPGFVPATNEVVADNGNWRATIKMQPKGAALRGRIVDAEGKGVQRAFVALSNGSDAPVATDANGDFALADAPLENVTLLISNGASFTSFEVKQAGQKVEIALPEAPPTGDKEALADKLLEKGKLGFEWKSSLAVLGRKRFEALLLSGRGQEQATDLDWFWGQYLEDMARREPQSFLERESELRAQSSPDNAPLFERSLMLARAAQGSQEQKEQVRAWLDEQEKTKRDISSSTVEQLLRLAEIGGRLDPKIGQLWLDYAGQIADQLPDNGGRGTWQWGKLVAGARSDAPFTFGDGWKPTVQLMLLNSATDAYYQTGDVENARKAYEQSRKLLQQSQQNPEADLKIEAYSARPSDLVLQTEARYASILARTNPSAALGLAPDLGVYEQASLCNTIARNAVKLGQLDLAKKALDAVLQIRIGNVELFAEAASIAQGFDPTYAETLWMRAYDKTRPRSEEEGNIGFASFATYAKERAQGWPGESRILIEREWQARVAKAAKANKDEENGFDENPRAMANLVDAMAKVSPTRALEMLPLLTQSQDLRGQTQTRVALTLLSK